MGRIQPFTESGMAQTFNCPNCGGANQYAGVGGRQKCGYCGTEIPVPAEMASQAALKKFGAQARPWIILFLIVVFVLPACGTLIGVGGSILGAIAAFIAPFIGR